MSSEYIFHLAFPIENIAAAKEFYVDGLGCSVGRETAKSMILNLYGHQLVAHISEQISPPQIGIYPRHFGIVFPSLEDWQTLHDRARAAGLKFYQTAKHRFTGEITEHHTFFLADPFGNLLEFKYYAHPEAIFGAIDFDRIGDASSE